MDIHFIRRKLTYVGVLCPLLFLVACASSGDISRNGGSDAASSAAVSSSSAEKPGAIHRMMHAVGLGKSDDAQASTSADGMQVPLRLYTASNLNAGDGKMPLALVVKIYHLHSLERFNQIPFDDFVDSAKAQAALGSDLIDSREMLLLPKQHYTSVENTPDDTRYLGVVALFRSPAALRWRFAYNVKKSHASGITLGLHSCAMSSTAGSLVTALPDDPGSLAGVHCATPSP